MTTKTIVRLEKTRARLQNDLKKIDTRLSIKQRRDERRTAARNTRKYYGLGCAVEVALATLWSDQMCRLFDMMDDTLYPTGELPRSVRHIPNPFRIIDGSTRQRRIRWGIVVCSMILYNVIPASELESAVRSLQHAGQRKGALEGLADSQDTGSDLAQQLMPHWPWAGADVNRPLDDDR